MIRPTLRSAMVTVALAVLAMRMVEKRAKARADEAETSEESPQP
mgnify:CR=1 FL=1